MNGNDTESKKRLQVGQISSAKRFLFVSEATRDEGLEELVEPLDVAGRVSCKVAKHRFGSDSNAGD